MGTKLFRQLFSMLLIAAMLVSSIPANVAFAAEMPEVDPAITDEKPEPQNSNQEQKSESDPEVDKNEKGAADSSLKQDNNVGNFDQVESNDTEQSENQNGLSNTDLEESGTGQPPVDTLQLTTKRNIVNDKLDQKNNTVDPENTDNVTAVPESISVKPPKKITYIQNQENLDLTDGEITVAYEDGTEKTVPLSDGEVTGFSNAEVGTYTLTVRYDGLEAAFDIAVTENPQGNVMPNGSIPESGTDKSLSLQLNATQQLENADVKNLPVKRLKVTQQPLKLQYIINEEQLDVTGGELTVFYSDDSWTVIPMSDAVFTGFDNTKLGMQNVTGEYGGKKFTVQIAVVNSLDEPILKSVSWKKEPFSGPYYVTDSKLNCDGAVILAEFSDGTSQEIQFVEGMVERYVQESYHDYGNGIEYKVMVRLPFTVRKYINYRIWVKGERNEGTCGDILCWKFTEDQTLQISGSGKMDLSKDDGANKVPWEHFKSSICKVELGNQVVGIAPEAFSNCLKLQEIIIPASVSQIESNAFAGCTALHKIHFEGAKPNVQGNPFAGVTADVFYSGKLWRNGYGAINTNGFGGNLTWISNSPKAEKVQFLNSPEMKKYIVGKSYVFEPEILPIYADAEINFKYDEEFWSYEGQANDGVSLRALKAGSTDVEMTDLVSGFTAAAHTVILEKNAGVRKIVCPFAGETTILYEDYQYFRFTPEEAGEYVFSIDNSKNYADGFYDQVEFAVTGADGNSIPAKCIANGPCAKYFISLEPEQEYQFELCFLNSMEDHDQVTFDISLKKSGALSVFQITEEQRICYLLADDMYAPIRVECGGFNCDGKVTWTSSDPQALEIIKTEGNTCSFRTYHSGEVTVTAQCQNFTDSIKITVKEPEKLIVNRPAQALSTNKCPAVFQFVPEKTGRYTFETLFDIGYGGCFFIGENEPIDGKWSSDGKISIQTGTFAAGVPYTFYAAFSDPGLTEKKVSVVVREEAQPVSMHIQGGYQYKDQMNFRVVFEPRNSYDNIVKWESSRPDILYNESNVRGSFTIRNRGEVTITAVSESGLRASKTITVGECTSGHTFGAWKTVLKPTCMEDGMETRECICGLSEHRVVSALGHKYDNNCDPECNVCGARREVTHALSDEWIYDSAGHWHVCTICGEKKGYQNHTPGPKATEKSPQVCTECGYVIQPALGHQHSFSSKWSQSESAHWHECSGCGSRKDYHVHVYSGPCDDTCNECGYVRVPEHVAGGKWISDRGGHWQICSNCGKKLMYHEHVPGRPATSTQAQKCVICGQVLEEARKDDTGGKETIKETVIYRPSGGHTHQYDDKLTMDQTGHWYPCKGCNGRKDFEAHTYDNPCDPDCNVCGYRREVIHNRDPEPKADETGHWYICKDCGEKLDFEPHRFSEGKCLVCGYEDPNYQVTEPTVPETTAPVTNVSESADHTTYQGAPWWVVVLACIAGSAVTLGGGVLIIWLNRKKIIDLLTRK